MTVKELHDELEKWIYFGHGELRVIANCEFIADGVHSSDFPNTISGLSK